MTEWRQTTLGVTADTQVGFAFKSADFSDDPAHIRLLRGVNIGQGELDWNRCTYWPREAVPNPQYWLQAGDVVLAMDRPWIEAGLKRARLRASDLPALLVQRVTRLRGTGAVRTSFIHHLIASETFSRYLQGVVTGATVPHISESQIHAFGFSLPSIQEQDQICGVLDALDDLIENNRRRIELLEQMAQAIYREWFVHFRYPGHEDVPFVDSPVGPIPEGWELTTVVEALTALGGGTPSKTQSDYWREGNIPWFTPSDLTRARSRYSPEPELRITDAGLAKSSAQLFPPGSVLMTSRATLGVLTIARTSATTNQGFIVIPPDDRWSPSFIREWLAHKADELAAVATGATFKEITKGAFKRFPFLVPGRNVLDAYRTATNPIEESIQRLEEQIGVLAECRDLLLPKLVTGQVDVSGLDLGRLVESVA